MIATATPPSKLFRDSCGQLCGPDRENNILRGFVFGKTGTFKTGRGRFTSESLTAAVRLLSADPLGRRARFNHPDPGVPYPLGNFLGRVRNPRLDNTLGRADLHFDPTAMEEPPGGGRPLGDYVMALAEGDHRAAGASMVLRTDKTIERDLRGRPLADHLGNVLPPLWIPTFVDTVDFVDNGDATGDSMLGLVAEMSDDDLLRLRWKFKKLRAGIYSEPDNELLRMRWENKKRKAGVGSDYSAIY